MCLITIELIVLRFKKGCKCFSDFLYRLRTTALWPHPLLLMLLPGLIRYPAEVQFILNKPKGMLAVLGFTKMKVKMADLVSMTASSVYDKVWHTRLGPKCTSQDTSGLKRQKSLLESGLVHRRAISGANIDKRMRQRPKVRIKTWSNTGKAIRRRNVGMLAMRRQRWTGKEDRENADHIHKEGVDNKAQV